MWEEEHAAWVAEGNRCETCERGFHGSHSIKRRWDARVVDFACWWDGTLRPLLHSWALFPRGGDGTWDFYPDGRTPRQEVEASILARFEEATRLRIAAEAADVTLEGHINRGPTQSRPDWEVEACRLDAESRAAWVAFADRLLEPHPLP